MQAEAEAAEEEEARQSGSAAAAAKAAQLAKARAARARKGLDVRPGYHWLIAGMTGVGKTYAATAIVGRLQRRWRVPALLIDSKGGEFDHLEGQEGVRFWRGQEPPPWPLPDGISIGVWSPERDNLADYERFLANIKSARRKCVLVVDELSSLGKEAADTFTPSLGILLKQGRALEITLVVLTQELAHVPRTVLRQTTHLVLMMQDPADPTDYDTLRAAKLAGATPVQRRYAFNYRSRQEPEKRWTYENVQQFLGMRQRSGKAAGVGGSASRRSR